MISMLDGILRENSAFMDAVKMAESFSWADDESRYIQTLLEKSKKGWQDLADQLYGQIENF